MLRDLWQHHRVPIFCLLIGVAAGWFLSWHGSELPTMSRQQERRIRADQARSWRIATADTAHAAQLDTTAAKAYASGQALAHTARQYHRLTTPKHAPLSPRPSPTATDSLQRLLSAY